jgi:glycosyltransferase involved in cell wall biosynthesis
MKLSVIICTHNPIPDYFQRTLEALKSQNVSCYDWELIIIDNSSNPPISNYTDLSWHHNSKIIIENELGILPARLRGIKETSSPLILFVDDDNVLESDYIKKGLEIAANYPFIGCWGGSIIPEYEIPPPSWLTSYKWLLACGDVPRDRWSNYIKNGAMTPPTAGMFLRRIVANTFLDVVQNDPRRNLLGRRGKKGLTNSEDTDLALTACDIGLGYGQFSQLILKHLIPKNRLTEDYIFRLAEGTAFTIFLVEALRGIMPDPYRGSYAKALMGHLRRRLFWERRRRMLFEAQMRARKRACDVIQKWQ